MWDEDADEVRPLKGARRGRRRRQRPLGPAAGLRCPPGAGSCRGRTSLTDAPAAAFSRPAPRAGTSEGPSQLAGAQGLRGPRARHRDKGRARGPGAKRGEASARQGLCARQCCGKFGLGRFLFLSRFYGI